MYSTKLNSKNRYIVRCIAIAGIPKVLDFIVDTGALYTCCRYSDVNSALKEKDFVNEESKLLGGIVPGYSIKFYKYTTNQFTIGNIDMGKRDIWITFDQLSTDNVLGMDILSEVTFICDSLKSEMYFLEETETYSTV